MKLNYRFITQPQLINPPIMLIHGLFGNLDNLGVLARDLQGGYPIIQVDLRNHGLSPHHPAMNYPVLAQDLLSLLDQLALPKVIIIGHSMGGKAAMALTAIAPERISHLVVLDIAPVSYASHHHETVFNALQTVTDTGITQRREAAKLLDNLLQDQGTIQFLLKSFQHGEWRFNVPVLLEQYPNILGWEDIPSWPHPTLFLKGEHSLYIQEQHRTNIVRQFPQAQAKIIANSGHWLHAEKPQSVLRAIHRFLSPG